MPKPGYRSLTIREETARRLESLAKEKRIGVVELVERYAAAVELIALKDATAVALAEKELINVWYNLNSITQSLSVILSFPLPSRLAQALNEVPRLQNVVTDLLTKTFPDWIVHIDRPIPPPPAFMTLYRPPLPQEVPEEYHALEDWFESKQKEELQKAMRAMADRLDECKAAIRKIRRIEWREDKGRLSKSLQDLILNPIEKVSQTVSSFKCKWPDAAKGRRDAGS